MATSGPSSEEYVQARLIAFEYELRRDMGIVPDSDNELFTNEEAATVLDIGVSTWHRIRNELKLSPVQTIGRSPRYSREQVEKARRHLEKGD